MFLVPAALLVARLAWCASGAEFWRGPHSGEEHAQHYSGEWTASIEGGPEVAQLVALQAGYLYVGKVLGFPDTYLLRRDDHALRRRDPSHRLTEQLIADIRVRWAEQQFDKTRVKRYAVPESEKPLYRVKRIGELADSLETRKDDKEINRKSDENSMWDHILAGNDFPGKIQEEGILSVTSHQASRKRRATDEVKPIFNDELWGQEWYLQDTRTRPELPRLDLNVLPVYQAGINGKGVRVVVLDDGIEHHHSDLRDNYDPDISWDCNDGDPDPAPRADRRQLNSHGTRCAGEIAMVANNGKCGVGVAWGARVGGVRMLDGRVNDRVEGEALGFAWDKVDIYSASWGPNDDGRTVEGPGRLAQHALERGVEKGRNGKGVIFVWANGNGGSRFDNCNCDGYSSSIYTVSIGSASQHGRFPWYGETCSSTLAAAYSSGAYGDQKIATTDVGDACTLKHTGTSAAAPLAAGIIALALQANSALNWRDVQHLLAWTSEQAPLADGSGWRTNRYTLPGRERAAGDDPDISWDCNDGDPDPAPRADRRQLNSHGTRCAGEIAMVANNGKCGVGVAWGARVGGVRMLDGRVNDRVEGEALGFAWDKVDIYSASWGPNDDGRTVEGPGRLAQHALERGVEKGRNGKGVIFVWANGNGGSRFDNCNCDGYSSSIYTVSIGSASQHGRFPWYGETCSSTLAAAYSSGAYGDQKIATTDVGDACTLKHTGTSAAAPLAAGIIALALQANSALNWRDVQHLLAWTSEQAPLADGSGWRTNSAGLRYDVRFGFGVLNAAAMVSAALNWTTVPDKITCLVNALPLANTSIDSGMSIHLLFPASGCAVEYLEHVELVANVRYSRRGALQLQLTSPRGTYVELLSPRQLDTSTAGFVNWRLSSVATWGERPRGLWTAIVQDKVSEGNSGNLGQFTLILHGTEEMPYHMRNGPRIYNDHYNINSNNVNYGSGTSNFNNIQNSINYHDNNIKSESEEIANTENINYKSSSKNEYADKINTDTTSADKIFENILKNNMNGIADFMPVDQMEAENLNSDGKNVYPILTELEKALLRVHHRMAKFSEENN